MPVHDSTPHIVQLRDTDPFTDPIRDKILSFEHLDEGWQFGEGVPAPAAMVQSSLKVLNAGRTLGLRADAFPGPEGEIAVVFYQGKRCLEILVRLDEEHTVFDVSLEEGIGLDYDEIKSPEGVSFHQVIGLIADFGVWNLHASYTQIIGIPTSNDIEVFVSATTTAPYLSLT